MTPPPHVRRDESQPARVRALALGLALVAWPAAVAAQGIGGRLQTIDGKTIVQEKLAQMVPADIALVDENGETVCTGAWFSGQRPVILNLGYFGCPRVCGAVLNGLMSGLTQLGMKPGEQYDLITVSIDPREKPPLAVAKKQSYLQQYPSLGLQPWHLYTGEETQIDRLCQAVGFGYAWNEHSKDYDHSAVTVFLSPEGKVSRYLYGYAYDRRDLRFAVLESAEGKVGSFAERLLVSCYAYDPQTREYRVLAIAVMQIGGVGTLIGLFFILFAMWRRERRTTRVPTARTDDLSAPREVTP